MVIKADFDGSIRYFHAADDLANQLTQSISKSGIP